MSQYLRDQNRKFRSDAEALQKRRDDWEWLENWVVPLMKSYERDAKESDYYDFVYVVTSNDPLSFQRTTNKSYIQLYLGGRPTGIANITYDTKGNVSKIEGDLEKSGCLSISQDAQGGVFIVAFPSESKNLKWKSDYLILDHFKGPRNISWFDVRKSIDFYFRFARYTSVYSQQSLCEKIELWCIELKFSRLINYIFRGTQFAIKLSSLV